MDKEDVGIFFKIGKDIGWPKFLATCISMIAIGVLGTVQVYDRYINENIKKELDAYKNFTGIILSDNELDLALMSPLDLRIKTMELSKKLLDFHLKYKRIKDYRSAKEMMKSKVEADDWYLDIQKGFRSVEDSMLFEYIKEFGTEPARFRSYLLKMLESTKKEYRDIQVFDEYNYIHPFRMLFVERIALQLDALARRLPQSDSITLPNIFKN